MPAFNAAAVVEALDYSLMPFVNSQGTIKEPTDELITDYLASVKKLTADLRTMVPNLPENASQSELLDAIDSLDPSVMVSMGQRMAEINAALCSNKPTKEELLAVPPRIRNIFYAWLQEQVMDPEVVTGGGAQQANGLKR